MIFFLFPILFYVAFLIFFTQHTAWTEMLVYPYLQNHGFLLYKDLIAPYTPLFLWFLQGVTGIFGYTPQVSLILTLLLALINTLLIFLVSSSLWKDRLLGIFSAAFYAFWFFYFEGNGLWFELFQTPFIIGSFYYLYSYFFKGAGQRALLLGSSFLAVSFFIKQSVVWIVLLGVIWGIVGVRELREKTSLVGLFLLPFALLLVATSFAAYLGRYLNDYWWWAYYYTFLQFPFTSGHSNYPTVNQIAKLGIPLVSLVPLLLAVLKFKKEAIFILLFLAGAFMSSLPRWGLFHLQPFLAVTAVAFVPFAAGLVKDQKVWKKVAVIFVVLIWVTVAGRQMARFWNMPTRFFEPEVYRMAEEIKTRNLDDYFVYNAPDQLYLLTGTVPKVKPYVQNFAWYMEVSGVQEGVVESLEQTRPGFIIYSPVTGIPGYNIGSYRPEILGNYIDINYKLKESLSENVWVLEREK